MGTAEGFPGGTSGKGLARQRSHRRHGCHPWAGKSPWRRKRQPTPVFLPEKSHGQRSLVGYSPWGGKDLNTTLQLNNNNSLPSSPPIQAATYYWAEFPVLCSRTLLVIHFKLAVCACWSQTLWFSLPLFFPLATICPLSKSVSLFLFCK